MFLFVLVFCFVVVGCVGWVVWGLVGDECVGVVVCYCVCVV